MTSRKDRRRHQQAATTANGTTSNHTSLLSLDPMEYVHENPNQLAVIGVGYGLGTGPVLRAAKRCRQHRRIVTGAAVVVSIVAMGCSLYYQQQQQGLLTSSSSRNLLLGRFTKTSYYPSLLSSLGGDANNSLDDKVCSASTVSSDDSMAWNAAAINKAASVILPRINVLQKGTSLPPSATFNQKTLQSKAKLHTPKSNVVFPDTYSTMMLPHSNSFDNKTKATTAAIVNNAGGLPSNIMSNRASIIIAYTQKMKRLILNLFIKFFVQPWKWLRGIVRRRK
jgi:hypothetical protein